MLGLIGKKIGMTRLFDEAGNSIPITVVQAGPCTVVQHRKIDKEGYNALQIGYQEVDEKKLKKPVAGHFKKQEVNFYKFLKEFRVDPETLERYPVGSLLTADMFNEKEVVDVRGTSKGKGFTGVMKRYNFRGKDTSHGTHESFRGGGSIGSSATPSRVFRGKKMPGHSGNEKVTVKNLLIFKVDKERNLLLIKGALPGHRNSLVIIRKHNR
jgi:large subunit ribosomal protein L3